MERLARHERHLEEVGWKEALLVGLAQAWALIPGSSRSGCTLTMGMALGFTREAAARFSFLLSVPIILGAGGYKLWKTLPVIRQAPDWQLATVVGTLVSFAAGYLVIGWLLGWLRTRKTYLFVVWRLVAGAALAILIARRRASPRDRASRRWPGRWPPTRSAPPPVDGDRAGAPAAGRLRARRRCWCRSTSWTGRRRCS